MGGMSTDGGVARIYCRVVGWLCPSTYTMGGMSADGGVARIYCRVVG